MNLQRFTTFTASLLALICVAATHAGAQAPSLLWQHSYGGSDYDDGQSVCVAADGGYVVAGSTYSNDGDMWGSIWSGPDFWVFKTDATGGLVWSRNYGGSGADRAYCVHPTSDSGFIVCGFTSSLDGDVTGNHGTSYDAWVLKLKGNGDIQWSKCYGGSQFDDFGEILQTSDGGYIAAGATESIDGDVSGYHGGSLFDFWVVKLDDTGGITWQRCYGGTNGDVAQCIIAANDSGYVVGGYVSSKDGDVHPRQDTANDVDMWVIKISPAGVLQWQQCLGGSGVEAAYSMCRANGGGYMVAGSTDSDDGDVSNFHGGDLYGGDYWVVRLNDTGGVVWTKTYGGSLNESAQCIVPAADSGYVVAGWSKSSDGDVVGHHDSADYWVINISDSGAIRWQKSLGGSSGDACNAIVPTSDQGYLLAGNSGSVNGDATANHGKDDVWLVKIGKAEGLPAVNTENRFSLYPNPNRGNFIVEGNSASGSIQIEIVDVSGSVISRQTVRPVNGNLRTAINLDCEASGCYLLVIKEECRSLTIPFVVY